MQVRTVRHDPWPRHGARGECGHGQAWSRMATSPRRRSMRGCTSARDVALMGGTAINLFLQYAYRPGRSAHGAGPLKLARQLSTPQVLVNRLIFHPFTRASAHWREET